ncbi:high frequency lysogenization protein HflD [Catenovulum sp. SM1970]|uniref:high frequency lysogenization protein HflD n=1 Tax=Marinifaba aquimaris TaxID=2741323 RepID=UPI001574987E|nr:high frequency lysogenization protein HflD [Marinifaba aquimaris]NTS78753.1 high frequency lysogenization protein HflD [Marinifaba aquimaris]
MSHVTYEQTLALAGISKACYCVQQLARQGTLDYDMLEEVLSWVLQTDPEQPVDVFGEEQSLHLGYRIIHDQLGHKSTPKDAELTRYVLSLMTLERKLMANKNALQHLSRCIEDVRRQLDHFEITDSQVVGNLAGIYKDVVSPLGTKIQILGNPAHLRHRDIQDKIRALLLAGVRATVLWRQLGGKRRNIIFRRSKWVAFATQALQKI